MPDIATVKDHLLQGRFIPPVGATLFEYGECDIRQIVEQFIENCRKLVELRGDGARAGILLGLFDWLERILESSWEFPVAFFGRMVYGEAGCGTQDMDAFRFVPKRAGSFNSRIWLPPDFVSLVEVHENETALQIKKGDFDILACGALLVHPDISDHFSVERIEKSRYEKEPERLVIERIPHAAAKIMNYQVLDTIDPEHRDFFKGKVLSSRYDLFVDLGSRPTLSQINQTYEEQLAFLPEPELLALTRAALKRMRVKKEHRDRIAKKYAGKLTRSRKSLTL